MFNTIGFAYSAYYYFYFSKKVKRAFVCQEVLEHQ